MMGLKQEAQAALSFEFRWRIASRKTACFARLIASSIAAVTCPATLVPRSQRDPLGFILIVVGFGMGKRTWRGALNLLNCPSRCDRRLVPER